MYFRNNESGSMRWNLAVVLVLLMQVQSSAAQQCRRCEADTFCFEETLLSCPHNSRSPKGSDNVDDCVCEAGYFRNDSRTFDETCTPCVAGSFCIGDEQSELCPADSSSDTFADSRGDCFCLPGHTGSGGYCTACGAGTAKLGNGGGACQPCVADYFMAGGGASECSPCPDHTNTQGAQGATVETACVSDPGYFIDDGGVAPCAAGTFQESSGESVCLDCRQDALQNTRYTLSDATASAELCEACPADSVVAGETSGSSLASCQCEAGFTGPNGGPCTACAAGFAKTAVGSAVCESCPAGRYASTANDECKRCTDDSTSPAESDDRHACVCNAGFGAETTTPFGCTECPAGTYQTTEPPALATCVACEAGKASDAVGATGCDECPERTWQPSTGQESCLACGLNSYTPAGSSGPSPCLCDPGFEPVESLCRACKPGSFKGAISNASCAACAPGLSSPQESTLESQCVSCEAGLYIAANPQGRVCTTCPPEASSPAEATGVSTCACRAGFTGGGGSKSAVTIYDGFTGKTGNNWKIYAESTGATVNGSVYSDSGLDGFQTPQDTSLTWNLPGIYDEFEVSFQNPKKSQGAGSRVVASLNGNEIGVSISINKGGMLQTIRMAYEAGGFLKIEALDNSVIGYNIDLRFYQDACDLCPVGSYKADSGSQACTPCGAGFTGATMEHIRFQTYINDNSGDPEVRISDHYCEECAVGTYEHSGVCTSCHANSSSSAGSSSVDACMCAAGYKPAAGTCAPCPAGSHKSAPGNVACTKCGENTYSEDEGATNVRVCLSCPGNTQENSVARDNVLNCVCSPGFTAEVAGVECDACADGSHKTEVGVSTCTNCPTGTYQPASSTRHTRDTCRSCPDHMNSPQAAYRKRECECEATFHRTSTSQCTLCASDFYCPDENIETGCPDYSTSGPGSVTVDDCLCDQGFSRVADSCQQCTPNTYCEDGVSERSCPDNSTTLGLVGQTTRSACVCNAGFFESDVRLGTCMLCGADTFCANEQRFVCGANASAPPGSVSAAACQCDALYQREGDACVRCSQSQVCTEGDGAVAECAGGATNYNQQCKCAPGTYCSQDAVDSCEATHACETCDSAHHCTNNRKNECKNGSTSPEGSSSETACLCVPGTFLTVSGGCSACAQNSYCHSQSTYSCDKHDENLVTVDGGSSDKDECVCRPGHFRLSLTDLCKPCPLNFYCPEDGMSQLANVLACQENEMTLETGRTAEQECVCRAGFMVSDDAASTTRCVPCQPGERCLRGALVDTSCGIRFRVPNDAHTECLCQPGYFENVQGVCDECAAAQMKSTPGNFECEYCAADSFRESRTHCAPCPANASSAPGEACVCRAPQVLRDGECVACPDDSFHSGPGSCDACPFASSTARANFEEVPAVGSCLCDAGFHRVVSLDALDQCEKCATGTYEAGGVCVSCGEMSDSAAGSSDISACTCNASLCKARVWDEFCAGGCPPELDACDACGTGHFKPGVSAAGNTDPCVRCPLHTFQEQTGRTGCDACHATRNTMDNGRDSAAQCLCVPGWQHVANAEACEACSPGSVKGSLGNDVCMQCEVGKFAARKNETECDICSDYSPVTNATTTVNMGSFDVAACTCPQGYFGDSPTARAAGTVADGENTGLAFETCSPCVVGSFKDAVGFQACVFCGAGMASGQMHNTYGLGGPAADSTTHCRNCPDNSGQDPLSVNAAEPMDSVNSCLCMPGFDSFSSISGCVQCNPYHMRLGFGPGNCTYCDVGFYFTNSYQACAQCTLHTQGSHHKHVGFVINSQDALQPWGTSSVDCACDLGFARHNNMCHACESGSFRNESLDSLCSPCALDTYQPDVASTGCLRCPQHSVTVSVGSRGLPDCLCSPGYERDATQQLCIACSPGFSNALNNSRCVPCEDRHFSAAAAQTTCTACASNEYSLSPRDSISACACDAGSGHAAGTTIDAGCSVCPAGEYSPGGVVGSQRPQCQACPAAKGTPSTGSVDSQACVCDPGHGVVPNFASPDEPCEACTTGLYAPGGENIACTTCGFGTVTTPELQATSFDQCMCNAFVGLREA